MSVATLNIKRIMKKQYMKPAMHVVRIQQQHIICSSPYDQQGSKSLQMYDDTEINSEDAVW